MNKNINTVVELTEKELECVTGGGIANFPFQPGERFVIRWILAKENE